MQYDSESFTFLADATLFDKSPNDAIAWVASGIKERAEVFILLQQQLKFPEYFQVNWDALYECLVTFVWQESVQRVVIIHSDLPALVPSFEGRNNVRIYLEVLLASIQEVKKNKAAEDKELIIIFPERYADQIRAILESPTEWEVWYGFSGGYTLASWINPAWSRIQHAFLCVDGLTADTFSLSRDEIGALDVSALRHGGYHLEYTAMWRYAHPDIPWEQFSSDDDYPRLRTVLRNAMSHKKSLQEEVIDIIKHFFHTGEIPHGYSWQHATPEKDISLSEEVDEIEQFISSAPYDMVQETVRAGMRRCVAQHEEGCNLSFWQQALESSDESERLTAICIVGRSNLTHVREVLRPFLQSAYPKERWVSARFLGQMKEPDAFSVLIMMLTEYLPPPDPQGIAEEWDEWYDEWRVYAPRLLRFYEDPMIGPALNLALRKNLETASHQPHRYSGWYDFRVDCCLELGRRGIFHALSDYSLSDAQVRMSQVQIAQGYYLAHHSNNLRKEKALQQRMMDDPAIHVMLKDILVSVMGFGYNDAEMLVDRYDDDELEISPY